MEGVEKKENENTEETGVKKSTVIDSTSPFHLYSSDNSGMMISSCILKGENYEMWVKAMRNADVHFYNVQI